MSKCIRRYYSKEENRIINQQCEFTKDNYTDLFYTWLGGDFKPYYFDQELENQGIVAYVNRTIEDPKEWEKTEGECVYQLTKNIDGKEELSAGYIKDCMIFCKMNKVGLPKSLTYSDMQFVNIYLERHAKKIRDIEIRSIHEIIKNPDIIIKQIQSNTSNKKEFLDALNTIFQNCNIKVQGKADKIRIETQDLSDAVEELFEGIRFELSEGSEDILKEIKNHCLNGINDPLVKNKDRKKYKQMITDIDYALEYEDDHVAFFKTFLKCLEMANISDEFIPFNQVLKKLFVVNDKFEKINQSLEKGNYVEAQKLYNKTFINFNTILVDQEDQRSDPEFIEIKEELQADLKELEAAVAYQELLEKLIVQYKTKNN